jgi:hypothetical protein
MNHFLTALTATYFCIATACHAMNEKNQQEKKPRILMKINDIHADQIAFLDNTTILANNAQKECSLFDIKTGEKLSSIQHSTTPTYLAVHPQKDQFALYNKHCATVCINHPEIMIKKFGGAYLAFLPSNDNNPILEDRDNRISLPMNDDYVTLDNYNNHIHISLNTLLNKNSWLSPYPITLITVDPINRNKWCCVSLNGTINFVTYKHQLLLIHDESHNIPSCENLYFCQYNAAGTHLITANQKSGVHIIDLLNNYSGKDLTPFITTDIIKDVAVAPHHDVIATLMKRNNQIKLWDIHTLECIATLPGLTQDSPQAEYDIHKQHICISRNGEMIGITVDNKLMTLPMPLVGMLNTIDRKKLSIIYVLLHLYNPHLDYCDKLPYDIIQLITYYTFAVLDH